MTSEVETPRKLLSCKHFKLLMDNSILYFIQGLKRWLTWKLTEVMKLNGKKSFQCFLRSYIFSRRFKALQHLVTLYLKTGNNEKMISCYKSMLGYMTNVSRNELTDAINIILDTLQTATQTISLTEVYKLLYNVLTMHSFVNYLFSYGSDV